MECGLCITTSDNCLTCADTRHGSNCVCIDGYFDKGVSECSKCENKCYTCITRSDNCIACSNNLRDPNNSCLCK